LALDGLELRVDPLAVLRHRLAGPAFAAAAQLLAPELGERLGTAHVAAPHLHLTKHAADIFFF
jgi:hypothetical protein